MAAVEVIHVMPGRVRLRARFLRKNPEEAHRLEDRLAQLPGVSTVDVSARTGSILILHEPGVDESFWEELERVFPTLDAEGFHAGVESFFRDAIEPGSDLGSRLQRALREGDGDGSRLRRSAALALAGLGMSKVMVSMIRHGRFPTPSWYDLLWYAYGFYSSAKEIRFEEELRDFEGDVREFGEELRDRSESV